MMRGTCFNIWRQVGLLYLGIASLITACSVTCPDVPESTHTNDYPVSLSASFYPDTRMTVEGTALSWDDEDMVRITAGASDGSVGAAELTLYSVDADDPGSASFTGFVSMNSEPQECIFTYPSKESVVTTDLQEGKVVFYYANQSGRHEPFLYASAAYDPDGIYAEMHHVGAMLELTVEMDGLSQISFVGNELEHLSPVTLDLDTEVIEVSTELGIQITVPVQTEGNTYISVPPVNLAKGFSLVLSKDDGTYMVKSYSSDGSLSGGFDFTDKAGYIIPITIDGEFESFNVSCSSPSVEHATVNGLLSGTQVSFTMSKSGSSDKLIEEWGAKLIDAQGNIVRSKVFDNETPIAGGTITMDILDEWYLLPGGTYTFAPYYKIYGNNASLGSVSVTVPDPGVRLVLDGETSYDKYESGDVDGANSHTNTLIAGVKAEINVHPDILDSFTASVEGVSTADEKSADGSNILDFGNLTRSTWRKYSMTASATAGKMTISASRDFHITGLPLTADFTTANPSDMSPSWGMIGTSYSDNRVVFQTTDAIRSPGFHIPGSEGIKVITACACRHNVTSNSSTMNMNIAACTSNATSSGTGATLVIGKDYYQGAGAFGDVGGFDNKGYLVCGQSLTLTTSNPSLIYSVSLGRSILGSNTMVSFGHKIEYSK